MNPALLNHQFVQVALPIMFKVLLAAWIDSRGMDNTIEGVNRRLDDLHADMNDRSGQVNRRLGRIDETLNAQSGKISVLEERTSPLARRSRRWKICAFCSNQVSSPEAVLRSVRRLTHPSAAAVDGLEAVIVSARLPVRDKGTFDRRPRG